MLEVKSRLTAVRVMIKVIKKGQTAIGVMIEAKVNGLMNEI